MDCAPSEWRPRGFERVGAVGVCLLSGLGARKVIPKLRCGLQKWFDVDALEEGEKAG